ncbi:MAG: glycosyltransferase [Acidobacteriota bacterium]
MRIALFHNVYSHLGGEERVVDFQEKTFTDAGHVVERYEVRNEEVFSGSRLNTLAAAWHAPWNPSSHRAVGRFVEAFRPDLAHVHNWFPLLSPSLHDAVKGRGVPIVQSLHNYRLGCASAVLRRRGENCTACLDGSRLRGVLSGCYRGSRVASFAWYRVMQRAWKSGVLTERIDAYLAPSHTVADLHAKMGLPYERLHVIPHACEDPRTEIGDVKRQGGGVFVGRLTPEKGLTLLLEAWRDLPSPLQVVGSGPAEDELRAAAASSTSIQAHGWMHRTQVLETIAGADFLVFPSTWPEPFGQVLIEAMALGRPVIASRLGAPTEIIDEGETGLLVDPEDPAALTVACRRLLDDPALCRRMGERARQAYEERHAPGAYLDSMESLHRSLVTERAA